MTEIWGHRGARGLFPENTLEGIAAALALGLAGVEIDVALTSDAIPVLSHDPGLQVDIARASDGSWVREPVLLRQLRAGDLLRFDVGRLRPGSPTALLFPDQSPIDGARVPLLDAVLTLDAPFLIELKSFPDRPWMTAEPAEMADAIAAAVNRTGAAKRSRIESFDWRGPRHLRRARPELGLAWLTSAATEGNAGLWWDGPTPGDFGGSVPRAVAAEGGQGDVWAPEHTTLTRERLLEAHDIGLRVFAWTVNEPADVARLIAWGVDGIISDRPDRALAVARGHPPP